MIIGVAGPYSAPTENERQHNLREMNRAAAALLAMGHTPLIGINAALPVLSESGNKNDYDAAMLISLAVIKGCDALLLLRESPGANRERDLILSQGKPVYRNLQEVPKP
jgi:hypothetical protein